MARVRMIQAHDFQPDGMPHVRIALKAGCGYTIKEAWATQLEFMCKAVREEPPPALPQDAPLPRRARRARKA